MARCAHLIARLAMVGQVLSHPSVTILRPVRVQVLRPPAHRAPAPPGRRGRTRGRCGPRAFGKVRDIVARLHLHLVDCHPNSAVW